MTDYPESIVIIPTYNNEGSIGKVIADVKCYASDILVINDGSTDGTSRILSDIQGIKTITLDRNRGKGMALKTGLGYAVGKGYRYAISIDADGQHYAEDIKLFYEEIKNTPDTLLIGARQAPAGMPRKNSFANRISNFWYRVETGIKLSDTQSGFRLYPLRELKSIRFFTSGYEFEIEIIVKAAWKGIQIRNIPINVYYAPKECRVSHFRPFRDFMRISMLNVALVAIAFLIYYPKRLICPFNAAGIRTFIYRNLLHSNESNIRMALSIGWGVFCGIIPVWGWQTVFAGISAHFLRLNKLIAIAASNISIPPMIPLILYGSFAAGSIVLHTDNPVCLHDISFADTGKFLAQYVAGSIILALAAGSAVTAISWIIMKICRRDTRND